MWDSATLEIIKWVVGEIIIAIPSFILIAKLSSDLKKANAETHKVDSDTKNEERRVDLESKKTEVDVAEKIIKSAGDLIETYKDMNSSFIVKQSELEIRIDTLQRALEKEIKRRQKLEKTILEFISGTRKLLDQLKDNKLVPVWEPKIELYIMDDAGDETT